MGGLTWSHTPGSPLKSMQHLDSFQRVYHLLFQVDIHLLKWTQIKNKKNVFWLTFITWDWVSFTSYMKALFEYSKKMPSWLAFNFLIGIFYWHSLVCGFLSWAKIKTQNHYSFWTQNRKWFGLKPFFLRGSSRWEGECLGDLKVKPLIGFSKLFFPVSWSTNFLAFDKSHKWVGIGKPLPCNELEVI